MADDENEFESVDVAPGKVLSSDKLNFTRPGQAELSANPFASLVRGRQPGKIGDILMKMGRLTLDQLQRGVAAQEKHPDKKLGEVLVDMGFVTPNVVEQALKQQQSNQQVGQQPATSARPTSTSARPTGVTGRLPQVQGAVPSPSPKPGTGSLPPLVLPHRAVNRWKTENQVRIWDKRLEQEP